ncbi:class I SAM-dependent methyltransferase [Leptolyngbya sp. 7M]|uniref:class I SAM-dependent methyltransferase n=1 Tax=Leptolyngbya sp. 7M TaxID=2812896 RepID=UPI001B8C1254|nr:class I SAM-dependent methyltransferase [Leptolyngbya sp. 7M]QYO66337.1 class I SAM-dependent methyltransferase [Leptolyngbya sp. 7M]
MTHQQCPLCTSSELRSSWLEVEFNAKIFQFKECMGCRSLICDPMPDADDLARMYDDSYCDDAGEPQFEDLGKFGEVLDFLQNEQPGRFIDYGCGDGRLLRAVKEMGWDVLGIDFNPSFAASLAEEGIRVIGHNEPVSEPADVVHLGDVLEHLTDIDAEFRRVLALLKPGGTMVAHGPLEANPNLFFRMIRFRRKFSREPNQTPPFHVLLSTTRGQRALFERYGLVEEDFRVREIAFPAPEQLDRAVIRNLRSLGLFSLRKISQAASRANLESFGNRYFYLGRKMAPQLNDG